MVEGIYWFLMSWAVMGVFQEFTREVKDDRPKMVIFLGGNDRSRTGDQRGQV